MTIIDRYLLRQFMQNFVICFVSLTGVYVVFDAFSHSSLPAVSPRAADLLKVMAAYYGYQSLFFFDRISSLLVLMSAMFTMAWIQRHHELTALMAAGISRIRVVTPVLAAAVAITSLAVVNRESRDSQNQGPACHAAFGPQGQRDRGTPAAVRQRHRRAHLRTSNLVVDQKKIELPEFIVPHDRSTLREYGKHGRPPTAYFLPAKDGRPTGYLLHGRDRAQDLAQRPSLLLDGRPVLMTPHDNPDWLKPNEAFVVSDVTIDELTGGMVMRRFCLDRRVDLGLKNRSIYFSPDVRVMIHSRILQPFLDLTLLFLGLPLVVARDNRNVFVAIGMCMGLVALFFIVSIACQQLARTC